MYCWKLIKDDSEWTTRYGLFQELTGLKPGTGNFWIYNYIRRYTSREQETSWISKNSFLVSFLYLGVNMYTGVHLSVYSCAIHYRMLIHLSVYCWRRHVERLLYNKCWHASLQTSIVDKHIKCYFMTIGSSWDSMSTLRIDSIFLNCGKDAVNELII